MTGNVVAVFRVRMACHLKGADDIQLFAGLGISARVDRTI